MLGVETRSFHGSLLKDNNVTENSAAVSDIYRGKIQLVKEISTWSGSRRGRDRISRNRQNHRKKLPDTAI